MSRPPAPAPAGAIGAVVVNHDAGPALVACVESLRRAGVDHVVVVDNASADGSLEALADADRAALLVPTGANLGYGRAANRGVAALDEELVLVCNPDLVVDPAAPGLLAAALAEDPAAAAAGPCILDVHGATYPSARSFPSPGLALLHAFAGLFRPENRWSRRYRRQDQPAGGGDPDWISGACFLVRRTAFASVGGFDEGYFMYVEDLDLCWRLRRAGWGIRSVPAARVVHAQGVSTARHPYRMLLAHHRSAWRFARHSTRGPARLALPLFAAGLATRLATAVAREALAGRLGRGTAPDRVRSTALVE